MIMFFLVLAFSTLIAMLAFGAVFFIIISVGMYAMHILDKFDQWLDKNEKKRYY